VPIIPFVVSDLKLTVATQHFFNTHDWINAFDASFNEASENLIDLMESEEADIVYEQKESRPQRKSNSKNNAINTNQKYIIGGIAAVFVLVLIAILFWQPSEKAEKDLVGSWFLTNYEDNMSRNPQEISDFQGQVTFLKQNFALTIKKDNTFERRGFSEKPEYGQWEVMSIKGQDYLKLTPLNQKEGDALMMNEFTEDKLVLSIASTIDSMQVITTLTLRKR